MLRAVSALRQKTDYNRWAGPRNIYANWEPRSKIAATLVPNHSRVIEFGAGKRVLERYLDPSCSYVPSDIVDRGPGTIVFDLNQRPLPDLGTDAYDVAVLLGVLEYVRDVPSFLDWLTKLVPTCVLGCVTAQAKSALSLRAVRETIRRMRGGWLNIYREDELISLFRQRGFTLTQDDNWEDQRLFVFSRLA